MEKESLIIYDNVAEKLVTWTEKRIGKFVKTYYEAVQKGEKVVNTGDDAIDMLVSCLLASSHRRARGGQPGNQNARRAETNKNESETNNSNNIIEYNIKEREITRPHVRTNELMPFPHFMTVEEKRLHLWRDIVDNKGEYPKSMLEDFAKYYGMTSTKEVGKLLCEECAGWDTKTMLERWYKRTTN